MGLYASLDICGEWGFPEQTPFMGLPIDYSSAGGIYASLFTELAQGLCPVDTGYLQSSISAEGGTTFFSVAEADYAQYVEYGTWKMDAQPFFEIAVKVASLEAFKVASKIYKQAKMTDAMLKLQELQGVMGDIEGMMVNPLVAQLRGMDEELREAKIAELLNSEWGSEYEEMLTPDFDLDQIGRDPRGGYFMPRTVSMNGIEIDTRTGEEVPSLFSNPGMWRPGTSMYNVAMERSSNHDATVKQLRQEIVQMRANMRNGYRPTQGISRYLSSGPSFSERTAMMSFAMGGNTGNIAQDLGYDVGALTMLNMMGAGHGMASSLGMGMLAGGALMLLLMPLMDALMGDSYEAERIENGISYVVPSIIVI